MKNHYRINGDVVEIRVVHRRGFRTWVLVDLDDLPKLEMLDRRICVTGYSADEPIYWVGNYKRRLTHYILGIKGQHHIIRPKNGNIYDCRKDNLIHRFRSPKYEGGF